MGKDSHAHAFCGQTLAIFWTTDTELRVTSVQGTGLAVLDLRPEELKGASVAGCFAKQNADSTVAHAHRRALQGDSVRFQEIWGNRRFDVHLEPLRSANGAIRGTIGAALGIEDGKGETGLHASEERFRSLIENSSDMIALVTAEGTILYASPSTTRILGYPLEEFVGRNAFEFVHPEDRERTRNLLAELVRKPGNIVSATYRLRAKDGSWRCIEGSGNNLLDEPNIQAIVTNYRDITERRRAEEALRESEARYRVAAEAASDAFITINSQSRILYVNAAAEQIFGYARAEVIGQSPTVLMPEYLREAHKAGLKRYCETGKRHLNWASVEITGLHKSGAEFPVEVSFGEFVADGNPVFTGIVRDITERRRAQEALRQAEEKYRSIVENAVEGIFQTTPEGGYVSVNPALARMYGYESPGDLMASVTDIGHQVYVDPNSRTGFKRLMEQNDVVTGFEYEVYRKDGRKIWLSENARAVRDSSGEIFYYEGTVEDITERKHLQDMLRQAQKMEAVGRLAGGIAHDFNNLLMVIRGHTELLLERLKADAWEHRKIEQIQKAADRAAALTHQLLAFSRMQVLQPKPIALNAVVADMAKMLQRLIGENIELSIRPNENLGRVKADPGQIEQVILNLAVNARDAMPRGGKLIIETSNAELDEAYARLHPPLAPGRYVMLAVSDTGTGMDAETQAHIFEPFFTTKEPGKGTGLGLATVYGVVKQSKGYVWVYSEPGKGTTFKIYLPWLDEPAETTQAENDGLETARGNETILLVEDERDVREVAREFLALSGYTVLEAKDGAQAIEIVTSYPGPIHVLVTDMVMPGMGGRALAERLSALRPETKVVYMSGYTEYASVQQGELHQNTVMLTKPFTRTVLSRAVREVLHGERVR